MVAASSTVVEVAVAAAAAAASALPQEQQAQPRPRPMHAGGANGRHHAYSRKDKSLGLLCSNFVVLYNREDVESVGLDEAAKRLGVERRRIYDIVNVLESVGILSRKAKNRYTWIGFGGIPMALLELKERALRDKSGLASQQTEQQSAATISDDEDDDTLGKEVANIENEKLSQTVNNPSDKPGAPRCRLRSDHRKEKSLGLLTQNFVKLFLTMEVDTISLDEAAKLLLGEGHEETNMRTKVRRLYDIANVLSSLNLIEKIQQGDSRKPAFRWLGRATTPDTENGVTVVVPPPGKTKSNKRAFGTELTNIDMHRSNLDSKVQKKAKLAKSGGDVLINCKLDSGGDVLINCKLDVRNRLGQGKQSGIVYGPFHPAGARKHELAGGNNPGQREMAEDWKSLSAPFRPQYKNQALSDLFAHYVDAWKTWYSEFAQGSNIMQQHFGHFDATK
ncbi:E2F transcription factor-like E2FE isoform X5 [Zea mays]|uniref:E2F transcription factor-like E2FE n=1 Tax=Zea mays TaxID=4577 RepID=A0A1D6HJS6_MAIZE|nr:E2F transcription factor-like E2FE isoform X5 [Zea mays]AQK74712.1 E2F transcription factor-like E2FE [Zea mays]|eukprot:XP_020394278.1 E2F transcription factor-like E2FE isoform X5 [Zea mays]